MEADFSREVRSEAIAMRGPRFYFQDNGTVGGRSIRSPGLNLAREVDRSSPAHSQPFKVRFGKEGAQ